VLLLAIRPAAAFLSLPGTKTTIGQRLLVALFGVRGIGSIYDFAFALTQVLMAARPGSLPT